jgi:hypothetical protein
VTKIVGKPELTCHEDAVTIVVTLNDGRRFEKHVEHAMAAWDRPLSDEQLETKFHRQASLVIGEEASRRLMDVSWSLPDLADAGEVARQSVTNAPPEHVLGRAAAS